MKNYQVELYRYSRHGVHGNAYKGICVMEIEANSKKEAKQRVLENMVGEPISNFNFPVDCIDMEHAPEFIKIEDRGNCKTYKQIADTSNHIINEYDIQHKFIIFKGFRNFFVKFI